MKLRDFPDFHVCVTLWDSGCSLICLLVYMFLHSPNEHFWVLIKGPPVGTKIESQLLTVGSSLWGILFRSLILSSTLENLLNISYL